ncbi:hypothetical protein B0H65DRAFT_160039 [Neurospora tetraspora]|uniref:Uncharacterized protein n=1 Tax=Neurospora tetraspora TaxID=94610 RepID=A0AAE0JHD8_9PEZI|nr:hypothetical protein B0H65DRAFT_160039 [Neurospora tetraspora]
MTSRSPSPPPMIPLPRDWSINDNANANSDNSDNDNEDDAQSDISIPYSSLTESTTSTAGGNGFLTPTSSDAHTVAGAEGVNLQTINSVLHEMDSSSSYHHDEHFTNTILMQWRAVNHDEIERQIVNNRNRDRNGNNRDRSDTATTLSTGNLRLHNTSQTSTTLASEGGVGVGEGGGARLDGNGQTRRRKGGGGGEGGEGSKSSLHDSSSSSSSSSIKSTTSPSNMSHDHDDLEFPPLTILSPAPTAPHTRSSTPAPTATHTRPSTPTPAYESAPSSPSGDALKSKPQPPPSKPRPPPSRYTRHAAPVPNQTFILIESSTGRALTLIDGSLRLVPVPDPDLISITKKSRLELSGRVDPCVTKGQCNWHWHCVETSGWLGFRNAASGTFLGHDMRQNIIASAYKHNGWEWMTVRPTPEGKGGYLMVTHWEKLYKIEFLKDRGGLVARDTKEVEGTVWEFVRV